MRWPASLVSVIVETAVVKMQSSENASISWVRSRRSRSGGAPFITAAPLVDREAWYRQWEYRLSGTPAKRRSNGPPLLLIPVPADDAPSCEPPDPARRGRRGEGKGPEGRRCAGLVL